MILSCLCANCYSFLSYSSAAPEQEWNKLLIDGLAVGKGEISPEDFYAVIKKRIERTLIRTVSHPLPRISTVGSTHFLHS